MFFCCKYKKRNRKGKRSNVYNIAAELFNDLLGIYFLEYYELSDAKGKKIEIRNMILISYFLKHIIMVSGLKMKNWLIKKNRLIQQKRW